MSKFIYDMRQAWKEVKIEGLLSEGDSGTKKRGRSALIIRNSLLQSIETVFSADTYLLLRQTDWAKYSYAKEDTDIVAALKTIFNLLYKIHLANTLDQGPLRHLNWPVYEIFELNRYKSLLRELLPKTLHTDVFELFNYYWPNSDKLIDANDEEKTEAWWMDSSKEMSVQENYFPQAEGPDDKNKPILEKIDESNLLKSSIDLQGDYIAFNFKNFLRTESLWDRISHVRALARKDLLKKSSIILELVNYIRDTFIYLDYLEARINAPGRYTDAITRKLHSLLTANEDQFFFQPLKEQLSIEKGQFFLQNRLTQIEGRKKVIAKTIDRLPKEEYLPSERLRYIQNKKNGLTQTHQNLERLKSRLDSKPIKEFELETAFTPTVLAIDKLIELLKNKILNSLDEFTPEADFFDHFIQCLYTLKGDLDGVLNLESKESEEVLLKKYQRLKSAYERLTYQIPKTCRVYLQKDMQNFFQQIQDWCERSPELKQIYHNVEKEEQQRHRTTVETNLKLIAQDIIRLNEQIQNESKYPMSEELKADYCDILVWLEDVIDRYLEDNSTDRINRIAALIFDLRRLERKHNKLHRNPYFNKTLISLDKNIEVLRQSDISFKRAILPHEAKPEMVLENSVWCECLNLENTLADQPGHQRIYVLKKFYEMTETIENKIMSVVINQSKKSKASSYLRSTEDGFYYKALYQETWKEYSFNGEETTETYTIKLLLNVLYQVRSAIKKGVEAKEALTIVTDLLIELPITEVIKLIHELPVFFETSGITGLKNEIIQFMTMLTTMLPGGKDELKKITQSNLEKTANPTGNPLNSLAYGGLLGYDLPKIMSKIPNINKIFHHKEQIEYEKASRGIGFAVKVSSVFGILGNIVKIGKNAAQILIMPNVKEFRDEKSINEVGDYLFNALSKADDFVAKTGLREHQFLLSRAAKNVDKLARNADNKFQDNLCQNSWGIIQGQPFLIKRIKHQEENLQMLKDELNQLKSKFPRCVEYFVSAMRSTCTPQADIDQLKLNHHEEIERFLLSYADGKEVEHAEAVRKLAESQALEIKKMQANGENSEHVIEKEKKRHLSQLERYKEKLSHLSLVNVKNIGQFLYSKEANKVILCGVMAEELSDYLQKMYRVMASKQQHILQVEQALFEKKNLLIKESAANLFHQAALFCKEINAVPRNKLSALIRYIFGPPKLGHNRIKQFETAFANLVKQYKKFCKESPNLEKYLALHNKEMLGLCKTVLGLPFISFDIKNYAEEIRQGIEEINEEAQITNSKPKPINPKIDSISPPKNPNPEISSLNPSPGLSPRSSPDTTPIQNPLNYFGSRI